MVRLPEVDRKPKRSGCRMAVGLDVGQGLAAIDAGLAFAEHVKVRTVEDENRFQSTDLSTRQILSGAADPL
ncbi:hypothetical protein GCM10010837_17340 [Aminobacter niigataensis]